MDFKKFIESLSQSEIDELKNVFRTDLKLFVNSLSPTEILKIKKYINDKDLNDSYIAIGDVPIDDFIKYNDMSNALESILDKNSFKREYPYVKMITKSVLMAQRNCGIKRLDEFVNIMLKKYRIIVED